MIKRTISILIITVMLFSSAAYAQNYSVEILSGMQVLPDELVSLKDENVTRAQFASVAAGASGLNFTKTALTPFDDVGEDNPYSGAIALMSEAGYMSGVGANLFAPDQVITGQQALTAFIRILGYEAAAISGGGWPDGYMKIAQRLGLFKAFSSPVAEPMSFKDLWELCDLVLEAPAAEAGYITSGDEVLENLYVSDSNETYMNKALDVYRYEGKVTGIDDIKHSCVVNITDSESNSPYKEGDSASFKVSATINILKYDNAPVEIYASGDGKLLSLSYKAGAFYKYAVISSVNGDERDSIKYNPSAVSEIMLLDDNKEYKVAEEGLTVYLNGRKTNESVELKGRYAKVITDNGRIVSLELWDMTEGGLITAVDYNQLVFVKGDSNERINDIEGFERRMVVINGEYRDLSELKPDSVFDYYVDKGKNTLIIFASEKKISDTYKSISDDSVEIGNLWLIPAQTIYASLDGSKYDDDKLKELLNCDVTVYIDALERVRYMRQESGIVKSNEFIGYFLGHKEGGLSTDEVAVVNLESDDFEKKIYTVSRKITYEDGLTSQSVYESAGADDGSAIYKFKINSLNEIICVSKATAFHGFADENGDAMVKGNSIGSFPQSAHPFMWVGGKRLYFDFDTRIVAMYKDAGETVFKKCTWNELSGKLCSDEDIIVRFFGREMSSDVDLMFMSGPLDTIVPSENTYGIITRISDVLNSSGENAKRITINNEYSYIMSKEDASGLDNNTFIYYSPSTLFGGSEISVISSLPLNGDIFEWVGQANSDYAVYRATVEKADKKRLYFTDGTSHFINRAQPLYFSVSDDGRLTLGSYMDGLMGRDVVYIADNSLIYAVFYTE